MGKQWKQWETLFSWAPKSLQMVTTDMKLKDTCSLEESYDQPNQYIKKKRHYIAYKCLSNQSYGFSSSHVWMWELDYKETWAPRIWCFWTTVLEKILESPFDCKEIQPVNPKVNQSWIFTGSTYWSWNCNTLATWCEELTHWKRPCCWEGLQVGEGDNREWDGWMASLTQWTWVWESSRSCWWTGKPGMLQYMGSQRVRHDWATELNWTEFKSFSLIFQDSVGNSIDPLHFHKNCRIYSAVVFFLKSAFL